VLEWNSDTLGIFNRVPHDPPKSQRLVAKPSAAFPQFNAVPYASVGYNSEFISSRPLVVLFRRRLEELLLRRHQLLHRQTALIHLA